MDYWLILDIPNVQNVMLPYAFKTVISPVVKSNYYINIKYKMSIMNLLISYPQLQAISVLFSHFLIQ